MFTFHEMRGQNDAPIEFAFLNKAPQQSSVVRIKSTGRLIEYYNLVTSPEYRELVFVYSFCFTHFRSLTLEFPIKLMPKLRRFFMPPDKFLESLCKSFSKPTDELTDMISFSIAFLKTPFIFEKKIDPLNTKCF